MRLLLDNVRIRAPEDTGARALLIEGDHIVALAPRAGDLAAAPRLDGGGATVVPGFVDAHGHLLAFAASLLAVDCRGAPDIAAIVDRIRARAAEAPPGRWIRAFGYDENDLAERRHPTRRDLDRAAPGHPVRLAHRGGHALVLSSLALARCGITIATEEPPGAYLDRELPGGEPSGLLFEMGDVVDRALPPLEQPELDRAVAETERMLLGRGVTAFHDAGAHNGPEEWRSLARLRREGWLRLRLIAMAGWDAFARGDDPAAAAPALAGTHVKIALSELGADVLPGPEELAARVRRVHDAGRDVAIHAVTEAGIRAAADAIAAALEAGPRTHRHRIEHASICPPDLTAGLAARRIKVVSQPAFLHVNGDRYLRTVEAAALPHLYPFGDWQRAGVLLAFGSDCPVAEPDPLVGLRAAVARRTAAGAVLPGDGMTFDAALMAATAGAAAAMGLEGEIGALRPGLRADLVILSADPAAERDEPPRVEATFIDGRPLYASPGFAERLASAGVPVDAINKT